MADEYVERVAAGLRAINKEPDAFIYFEGNDSNFPVRTYDTEEVLGVHVLRCTGVYDDFGFKDHDVPFVPVWRSELHNLEITLSRFMNAYYNFDL